MRPTARKEFMDKTPNVQIEGRAAFGASHSNARLGRILPTYDASEYCWGNESMQWRDRKHINSPQQVVNVNNCCYRNGLNATLARRMLVDREHDIQMLVAISQQRLIG